MTPHLPAMTARQLINVAERLGFVFDRQRGSHAVYYRETDCARIIVPLHQGKTIKPKTLLGILHDMGITVDQFHGYLSKKIR